MRLAVCDEQWLFASVLAAALAQRGHDVVTTTDDPRSLLAEAVRFTPDLCLLDIPAGPPSAIEIAASLHQLAPAPAVVLLTHACDDDVWDAYASGLFDGLLNKACGFPTVLDAIHRVAAGERVTAGWTTPDRRTGPPAVLDALTTRELEVLRLVIQGSSTEAMADHLGVSRHTVRTHVQQVLRKLGVHGRGKLAGAAAAAGLLDMTALTPNRLGPRS